MSSGKRLNDVRGAQKANMTRESHTKTSCLTWRYQTVKILESSFRAFRPRLKTKLKHWLNISYIIRYGFLTRNTNKSLVWQLSKIGWYLHEHASIVFSFCWICSVNVEYYVAFLFALAVSTKYLAKAWSVNEIFIAALHVRTALRHHFKTPRPCTNDYCSNSHLVIHVPNFAYFFLNSWCIYCAVWGTMSAARAAMGTRGTKTKRTTW